MAAGDRAPPPGSDLAGDPVARPTAEGRLVDAAGHIYAHGTSTCLRFPL